ncbi:putative RNA recognition motif domain, nucleotide-binding alpha-beta plait domain superfamily [Helianthus annuus]|nr:putative RNA recognition motif domain, nucleotide-binding alpha-beta plait domain superfamily [Helianthus annuus]
MDNGGGEPDNGGPWYDVHYRKNNRGRGDGVEWTFLVQNLADKVTRNVLWRAFKPFGFVSDVYVARKRDSKGKCFGFVRYVGVEDMKATLTAMNSVTMFNMKVLVSLAKYDKDHKKIPYSPEILGRSVWRQKVGQQQNMNCGDGLRSDDSNYSKHQVPIQGPSKKMDCQDGRTFADLFKGGAEGRNNSGNSNGAKVVNVGGKGSLYPLHCIGRSILGTAKNFVSIGQMRQSIEEEGLREVGLSYVGGVTFLLTCRDKEYAKVCMDLHEGFFKSVFSKYHLWNGEEVPYSRLVNLNITGVPFIIRDNTLFDNIGSLFGEVVEKSSFSWQEEDNSNGSVTIVTSTPSKIEEAIVIKWNNKTIVAWVMEVGQKWMPDMVGMSMLDSEESESEMASESDEESAEMEDMEEGEFRQGPENPEHRNGGVDESGRSEKSPVEKEKSMANQETMEVQGSPTFEDVENIKGLHGNGEERLHGEKVNDHVGSPINRINDGGSINAELEAAKGGPVLNGKDDGPVLGPNLGKRNREDRSPPSIGSMQGPTQRLFSTSTRSCIEPIDLNTPIRDKSDNIGGDSSVRIDPVSAGTSEVPVHPVAASGLRDRDPVSEVGDVPANGVPQRVIEDEVEATIRVGSLIGVDLNGFVPATEKLVVEEGVSTGLR